MNLTDQQVKEAMISAGIERVDHHDCSLCGHMTFYIRRGDQLYFSSACGCSWSPMEAVPWSDASEWINMQSTDSVREDLMRRFGVPFTAARDGTQEKK